MAGGLGRVIHHRDYYLEDGSVSFLVGFNPTSGPRSIRLIACVLWRLQDGGHFVQTSQVIFRARVQCLSGTVR